MVLVRIVARFLLSAGENPPSENGPEQDHQQGVGGDASATTLAGNPFVDSESGGSAQNRSSHHPPTPPAHFGLSSMTSADTAAAVILKSSSCLNYL